MKTEPFPNWIRFHRVRYAETNIPRSNIVSKRTNSDKIVHKIVFEIYVLQQLPEIIAKVTWNNCTAKVTWNNCPAKVTAYLFMASCFCKQLTLYKFKSLTKKKQQVDYRKTETAKASSSNWADLVDKSQELEEEAERYRNKLRSFAEKRARTESETTGVPVEPRGDGITSALLLNVIVLF